MKKLLLLLPFLSLLVGCNPAEKQTTPTLFVSIPPQAGLLKELVQDDFAVETLLSADQSPHDYEPSARQLAALSHATLFFTIGIPFESALLPQIRGSHSVRVVPTDSGIIKRQMPHDHAHCSHGDDHHHGDADPHLWLTPPNAIQIASNMKAALCEVAPEKAELFAKRFEQLEAKLTAIDLEAASRLMAHKNRSVYVFHPSFGYFCDHYGLRQVAIEFGGKEPTPKQLAQTIEQAKRDQVKTIFIQKQFPVRSAQAIAKSVKASIEQLDPLAEDLSGNLRFMAQAIDEGMQP